MKHYDSPSTLWANGFRAPPTRISRPPSTTRKLIRLKRFLSGSDESIRFNRTTGSDLQLGEPCHVDVLRDDIRSVERKRLGFEAFEGDRCTQSFLRTSASNQDCLTLCNLAQTYKAV
ncbi:hypothetical protein GJ744_009064 [Endocarpon pusillum]|uniref:Uncharacterized protein n=1 Tax=Endocarpon pusillum TaxID=364733 RepID=A0A8H7AKK5_9EURO|nr:hypothetical protein GJ744_009064 [Endocarpon pusillum]